MIDRDEQLRIMKKFGVDPDVVEVRYFNTNNGLLAYVIKRKVVRGKFLSLMALIGLLGLFSSITIIAKEWALAIGFIVPIVLIPIVMEISDAIIKTWLAMRKSKAKYMIVMSKPILKAGIKFVDKKRVEETEWLTFNHEVAHVKSMEDGMKLMGGYAELYADYHMFNVLKGEVNFESLYRELIKEVRNEEKRTYTLRKKKDKMGK